MSANGDREVFCEMFKREEPLQFQTYCDKKKWASLAGLYVGQLWEVEEKLDYKNDHGAAVSLTINPSIGGRKAEDITGVAAVWADLDGSDVNPALDLSPHLTVLSSPGKYHCYWLTSDVPLAAFTQTQLSIASTLDSDTNVADVSRAMRVPGFFHNKQEPFLSKIVQKNLTQDKFTWRQLIDMFPPPKVQQWAKFDKERNQQKYCKKDSNGVNLDQYKGEYGEVAGNRNHSCIKIIGGMIARGLPWERIEEEVILHGISCAPPMSQQEVKHVLKSGRRYYDRKHSNATY